MRVNPHPLQLQLAPSDGVLVAHMGEHVLEEGGPGLHLYTAVREELVHRWVGGKGGLGGGTLAGFRECTEAACNDHSSRSPPWAAAKWRATFYMPLLHT